MVFYTLCPLCYPTSDEKSLPCVKGGGTACRDGGIVKSKKQQSLSRLRRQLPLHKGAFLCSLIAYQFY